jgi:error-prone DNA polymerase
MRLVKGLQEAEADRIADAVKTLGPFHSVESLWRASGVSTRSLRRLARADAFNLMGLNRQSALWQIRPLRDEFLPLFETYTDDESLGLESLPEVPMESQVLHDYQSIGRSLKRHPVSFIRKRLAKVGAIESVALRNERVHPQGSIVAVGGVVLARQRPGTASGVVFVTLEDETGIANLILWRNTYERYRRVVRLSRMFLARGRIEREGEVIHIHAQTIESLDEWLPALAARSRDFH